MGSVVNKRFLLAGLVVAGIARPEVAAALPRLEQVVAASRGCGMKGITIQSGGRRKFYVEWADGTTQVTFSSGPPSAAQKQEEKAFIDSNLRRWDCLKKWGSKRGIKMEWGAPRIIYD